MKVSVTWRTALPLDQDILGRGIYTPREAARLVGGSSQEVLRWTRGSGPNEPLWKAHYQFIDDTSEISFQDLIEVRVVRAMRKKGISLQSIRFAIDYATKKLGVSRPLSSLDFKIDGTEILMAAVENDGNVLSLSKKYPGQKIFKDIVAQSLDDLEYEGDKVARWRPKGHAAIVIDPSRSFGDPILDDFGISTATLRAEFDCFQDERYLAKIYEIPLTAVNRALKNEHHLDEKGKSIVKNKV